MARFSSRVLVKRVPTLISRFALTRQFCMTLLYSQNSKTRQTLICLLACIYLVFFHFCLLSGKTRKGAVVSHLVEAYWDPLWDWLVNNREGIFIASEVRDFLEITEHTTLNKDLKCNQMHAYSLTAIAKKNSSKPRLNNYKFTPKFINENSKSP